MIKKIFICDKCGRDEIEYILPYEPSKTTIIKVDDKRTLCPVCRREFEKLINDWWNDGRSEGE